VDRFAGVQMCEEMWVCACYINADRYISVPMGIKIIVFPMVVHGFVVCDRVEGQPR
jgi:hypothetical protein